MLTVPEEIKEILHLDSAYKNIRIHFPNSERQDICNNLIVKDSVKFKESICSQDALKFGLCEASVFECETVGVGNIKGATIEVYCEIECPVSVNGAVWRADLQKHVYPIPYGTFAVSESKRQADVNHRKIIAYSIMAFYDFKVSKIQRFKFDYAVTNNIEFEQALPHFINEFFQCEVFAMTYSESASNYVSTFYTFDQQSVQHTHKYYFKRLSMPEQRSHNLIRVTIDESIAGKEKYILYDYWDSVAATTSTMPHGRAYYAYKQGLSYGFKYLYPEMSMQSAESTSFFTNKNYYVSVLYRYEEYVGPNSELIRSEEYFDPDNIKIQVGSRTAYVTDKYIWSRAKNDDSKYQVPNVDEIDLRPIIESYIETRGCIGKFDRYDDFYLIDIKRQFGLDPDTNLYPGGSLYPQSAVGGRFLPGDYQSCWYDNEYRKFYGAVTCQYKDENGNESVIIKYLDGYDSASDIDTYDVYDLSNNEIVKLQNLDRGDVGVIMNRVVAALTGMTYMAVDFVGRGLPYVETGDTFEILTRSNDSITTIVLNRTLSGEQVLTDSYKSV